jgi:hypothetical protein
LSDANFSVPDPSFVTLTLKIFSLRFFSARSIFHLVMSMRFQTALFTRSYWRDLAATGAFDLHL